MINISGVTKAQSFKVDRKDTFRTDLSHGEGIAAVGFNYTKGFYLIAIHVYENDTYEVVGYVHTTKAKMSHSMLEAERRFNKFVEEYHLTLRSGSILPNWLGS